MREEVERIFSQLDLKEFDYLSARKIQKKLKKEYGLKGDVLLFVCVKIILEVEHLG